MNTDAEASTPTTPHNLDPPIATEPKPTRALNVIVPASVHRKARVAAAQSGMPLKDFIARVLEDVTPFPVEDQR